MAGKPVFEFKLDLIALNLGEYIKP